MGKVYFLTQEATESILLRVTNVCGECYSNIKLGDTIHYDMQRYRYLCEGCQSKVFEEEIGYFIEKEEITERLF